MAAEELPGLGVGKQRASQQAQLQAPQLCLTFSSRKC